MTTNQIALWRGPRAAVTVGSYDDVYGLDPLTFTAIYLGRLCFEVPRMPPCWDRESAHRVGDSIRVLGCSELRNYEFQIVLGRVEQAESFAGHP